MPLKSTVCYIEDGLNFADLDWRFSNLLATSALWLEEDHAFRARLGLHELLVNIRQHAYEGNPGPIRVGIEVAPDSVVISVFDWGRPLGAFERRVLPATSDEGGYGMGIIDRVFSDVAYCRNTGRNEWTLILQALDLATPRTGVEPS